MRYNAMATVGQCRNCWEREGVHCATCSACPDNDCPDWCERPRTDRTHLVTWDSAHVPD